MPSKKTINKQILQYAAGMGVQALYVIILAVVAIAVSFLALRWF